MIRFFPAIVPRLSLKRPLGRVTTLLALTALLAICGPMQLAAAPDDEELQPAEPEQEFGPRVAGNVNWLAQFDITVFSAAGGAVEARSNIDARLKVQIDELDRTCRLSEAQRKKLLLAAEGDAKRFFYEVSELRRKFEAEGLEQNANAFGEMWQEIAPLRTKYQVGIFGETALFSKAIPTTLTSDQIAGYRAVMESRRRFRHQSQAQAAMVELEKFVPLENSQYEALLKLLLDQVQPREPAREEFNSWQQLVGLATLPQDKVRPIFDERQEEQFKRVCDQVGGLKPLLIKQGVIPDPESEESAGE